MTREEQKDRAGQEPFQVEAPAAKPALNLAEGGHCPTFIGVRSASTSYSLVGILVLDLRPG
jgi:hypothetical protein